MIFKTPSERPCHHRRRGGQAPAGVARDPLSPFSGGTEWSQRGLGLTGEAVVLVACRVSGWRPIGGLS